MRKFLLNPFSEPAWPAVAVMAALERSDCLGKHDVTPKGTDARVGVENKSSGEAGNEASARL